MRQRSQRSQEFAPPSSYKPRGGKIQGFVGPSQPQPFEHRTNEDSPPDPKESLREERRPEFAPPATHEYYGPSLAKNKIHHKRSTSDVEAAISKGIAHLRKMIN